MMSIVDGEEIVVVAAADRNEKEQMKNEKHARAKVITRAEIEDALKKEKDGKSPGLDEIRSEMIKALEEVGVEWLFILFNKMWDEKRVPDDFLQLVLVPIPKKGDLKKCANYRGISLISIIAKCYARILEAKLRTAIADLLEEFQHGFMKGKGTSDCSFILRLLIERIVEFDQSLFITFMDLEKAYDFVERGKVWEVLEQSNVSRDLIDSVKSLYRDYIH
jgi:hypothetical protein